MKKTHSYKRIVSKLSAGLLAMLFFAGCKSSEHLITPPVTSGNEVSFTVNIPGARTPSTKGMTDAQEYDVQSIDLVVFDARNPANETFHQWIAATVVSSTDNTVTFKAKLTPTAGAARIVVVANRSLSLLGASSWNSSTRRVDIMKALTHTNTGKWITGTSGSGHTAIPMYGEKLLTTGITTQMAPVTGIQLTRMLARIDIKNQATGFVVEEVYLANFNTVGNIAPAFDGTTGLLDDSGETSIPASSGPILGAGPALKYSTNLAATNSFLGEIYTYESLAAEDGAKNDAPSRKDATCLVIKGKMGSGQSYFYRVDFTQADGNYMPLKRNYRYIVQVDGVHNDAVGYESVAEAINSYTVVSNLKTNVVAYNGTTIKDIVYNGQHMLGLQDTELTYMKWSSTKTLKVFTDDPNGWTTTVAYESGGTNWLSFVDNSDTGVGERETSTTIQVESLPDALVSRSAVITVTAGRLSNTIRVTQTNEIPPAPTFKVIDEEGNEVTQMFFQLNKASQLEVEPQTIYVMWAGDNINCLAVLKPPANKLPDYQTFDPNPGRDGADQLVLQGGIQAITIQPRPGSKTDPDDWWREDNLTITLYGESGSEVAKREIYIAQGELTFNFGIDPDGYLMANRSYQIPLETNAKWTIKKVTATGATLGQLLAGGDIWEGNTADPGDGALHDPLTIELPQWSFGVNGTVTVTFELVYGGVTFEREYKIDIKSSYIDYLSGTNVDARFYVSPIRFIEANGDPTFLTYSTAQTRCVNMGLGPDWRLPTLSELSMSYAYVNAVGGMYGDNGWLWPHYWTSSKIGSNYMTVQFDLGYLGLYPASPADNKNTARCVYVNPSPTGTVYPYINANYVNGSDQGVLIVSRDGNNGIDASALFGSPSEPSSTSNKVAKKLLVAKTDLTVDLDWNDATTACPAGWRLPTQREVYLIMSLGGAKTAATIENPGYDNSWPDASRISSNIWTLTEKESNVWVFLTKDNDNLPGMIELGKGNIWPKIRCVKSVE